MIIMTKKNKEQETLKFIVGTMGFPSGYCHEEEYEMTVGEFIEELERIAYIFKDGTGNGSA